MHHSSGTLVSGRVDASSKSAMNDPVSERSKSWSSRPACAETEGVAWLGFETRWSAIVVGAGAAERDSSCEMGGASASLSRLSGSAVMPSP